MAQSSKAEQLYGEELPYTITLDLRGVTDFWFNQMDLDEYEAQGESSAKKKTRKRFNPEHMVWRNDAGELAYPVEAVVAAITAAGKFFKTPIGSQGSAKTTLTQGLVPAESAPGKLAMASFGVKDWNSIDRRMGRNSDTKRSPRIIKRPQLDTGWLLRDVAITMVLPELYGPAKLMEIVTKAGIVQGIGDGRALGKGRFVIGRHEVEEGLPWE